MRKLHTVREQRRDIASVVSTSPEGLLAPLNRMPQSKRTQQLIELVRILQEIEHVEAVFNEVKRQLSADPNYDPGGRVRAPSRIYAAANEILSACHWSPRVIPPPQRSIFVWDTRTNEAEWENCFVFWLLNIRAAGDLSLIRSCRNCRRWFYAITSHQAYCSGRCRQQFHSGDQGFKERRRLYMRRYRSVEKARELTERKLIRTSRGSRS
jgi:hypothetical protein